jgi:hypothetical protein
MSIFGALMARARSAVLLSLLLLVCAGGGLLAQRKPAPPPAPAPRLGGHGFFAGVGLGAGWLRQSCQICQTDRNSGVSGYVMLGSWLGPTVRLGAEASGWLKKENGISNRVWSFGAVALWAPGPRSPLHVRGGLGVVKFAASDTADKFTATALGGQVGLGYDVWLGAHREFALTPYFTLRSTTRGDLAFNQAPVPGGDSRFTLIQVGLGLTWH